MNDRRSGLADVLDIVEASVVAADLAYDIQEQAQSDLRAIGHLDLETVIGSCPATSSNGCMLSRPEDRRSRKPPFASPDLRDRRHPGFRQP